MLSPNCDSSSTCWSRSINFCCTRHRSSSRACNWPATFPLAFFLSLPQYCLNFIFPCTSSLQPRCRYYWPSLDRPAPSSSFVRVVVASCPASFIFPCQPFFDGTARQRQSGGCLFTCRSARTPLGARCSAGNHLNLVLGCTCTHHFSPPGNSHSLSNELKGTLSQQSDRFGLGLSCGRLSLPWHHFEMFSWPP